MPTREAYLLTRGYRDMFTKDNGSEIDEVSQKTTALSDFCDAGLQASGMHRYQ
jgi:hypothetical protein